MKRPFPAYAYLPGSGQPHPIRHSAETVSEEDWDYGLQLFQAGYYWEAHEAWEGLWLQEPRGSLESNRLRGMIQLAAALLKKRMGNRRGAESLWAKSRQLMSPDGGKWRGLDLADWVARYDGEFDVNEGINNPTSI